MKINLPIAIQSSNRFSRVLLPIIIDKCKSFALSGNFVLGQEDSRDVAERLE